jgi:hypothetical protein
MRPARALSRAQPELLGHQREVDSESLGCFQFAPRNRMAQTIENSIQPDAGQLPQSAHILSLPCQFSVGSRSTSSTMMLRAGTFRCSN